MTGGYTLHTQTGLLKLPVCVRLLYPWLAYCAPRPKHRLSLPSSQNSSLNCALFFSRTGPASVGNQHSPPTAESRPGQVITTHRNLAGVHSSISSWCVCRAPTTAAADWLDRPVARRNTQAVCPDVRVCVRKHGAAVAGRKPVRCRRGFGVVVVDPDSAVKYRSGLGSVETSSTRPHGTEHCYCIYLFQNALESLFLLRVRTFPFRVWQNTRHNIT